MCPFFGNSYSLYMQVINAFIYSIPLKRESRQKWIEAIKDHTITELLQILTQFQVCSMHFDEGNIKKNGKLRDGAIPTIFK